jgi:hypothetical protein
MFIRKRDLDAVASRGWQEGFDSARKKVTAEIRKVLIKLISQEIKHIQDTNENKHLEAGLERAIEIIRKGKR